LTQEHWTPKGVAMEAETDLGETEGGLQAPHVIKEDGAYCMFYGDFVRICLARSRDGKSFERVLGRNGQPDLFSGPYRGSRDAMVLKIHGVYHCYYTGHREHARPEAAVFCRTSSDLHDWSDSVVVSCGGAANGHKSWFGGDCECPFVVERNGRFCLFRNQRYRSGQLNTQYCSPDPLDFGVDDDRFCVGTLPVAAPEIIEHAGRHYIAALMPDLDGIRIAPLDWVD